MTDATLPPFDAAHAARLPRPPGGAIVIAVSRQALREAWTPRVAADMASAWAEPDSRLLLVDADLAVPALHGIAGLDGTLGLTDVLAGRCGLPAAVQPVSEGHLHLLPAGAFPADPYSVLEGDRWESFLDALRPHYSAVVTYLPLGEPWSSGPLDHASDLFLLGNPSEEPPAGRRGWTNLRAVVAPGTGRVPREGLYPSSPEPVSEPSSTTVSAQPSLPPPPPAPLPAPRRPPSPSRTRRIAMVAGVAALALVGLFLVRSGDSSSDIDSGIDRSELLEDRPSAAVPSGGPATASEAARPSVTAPRPRFSIQVGSFSDPANADARRAEILALAPDLWVARAPVEVGGQLFHRLLVGMEPDVSAAGALGSRLAQIVGQSSGDWEIQATPRGFLVLATPSGEAAVERIQELRDEGLPAYELVEILADRPTHRVYVGAYATMDEAAFLGRRLTQLGVESQLAERIGDPPS